MSGSFENRHSAITDQQQRSGPQKRRLKLFTIVLPCFTLHISRTHSVSKQAARMFWLELLNRCAAMQGAIQKDVFRFDCIDNRYDGILKRALEGLEALVRCGESEIIEELRASTYPRLEGIRQETLGLRAQQQERTPIPSDESDDERDDVPFIELNKPETEAASRDLIETLNVLSEVVKSNSEPSRSEAICKKSKTKPSMALFLNNLFSSISNAWNCTCMPNHQAALLLFSNRPPIDSAVTFTVLLSRGVLPLSTKQWQAAAITVTDSPHVTSTNTLLTLRTNLPEKITQVESSTPIDDLCSIIKKSKNRLHLGISGCSLSALAETKCRLSDYEYCEPVSFTAGVLENDILLKYEVRSSLALVLSYAFLDFCDGPWFDDGWTKTNLYFMQRGDRLLLQPFLVTNMAGIRTNTRTHSTPTTSTRAEKLLQHGILLMEIFQQDSFPPSIGEDGNIQSLKDTAYTWFCSLDWDIYKRRAQIVEACIQGELVNLCSHPNGISDEEFIRLFCERILAPLEADFALFHRKDPDQIISELSLPSVKLKSPSLSMAESTELKSSVQNDPIQTSSRFNTQIPPKSQFLFDVDNYADLSQAKSALQWFKRVDEKVIRERTRSPTGPDRQIIIAVLDTGIDLENTWIDGESRRIKCWPARADHKDNNGHRTHVAHLLLRLAPNALLRICKVSNTTLLRDANINQITKAITYFSTGDARVDIINLSFGFPEYTKELTSMLESIRTARKNGVVIFAAAGNGGGNRSVFWPATLYSSGYVICISSSNGFGVQSGFNPQVENGRRICTLGEGVPSYQRDLSSSLQVVHRSGTSFATPIAAAIAAIVLAVMDKADYRDFKKDKERLLPRLRTARGMESVLCKTCVEPSRSNTSGFSYIAPWFFVNVEDKTLVPRILEILKSIPESPLPSAEQATLDPSGNEIANSE